MFKRFRVRESDGNHEGLITLALLLAALCFPAPLWAQRGVEDAFAAVQGGKHSPIFGDAQIAPAATVQDNVVYVAFQNANGQPVVGKYDISRKRWSPLVLASNHGLGHTANGAPSIYVDRSGFVHLLHGCEAQPLYHLKSSRKRDIERWETVQEPTSRATFPQIFELANRTTCLFYSAGTHLDPWQVRTSRNRGDSWSKAESIIELRSDPDDENAGAYAYFFPGHDGKTIHCFFQHKDDNCGLVNDGTLDRHPSRTMKYPGLDESVYRYNIYYVQRKPTGRWVSAGGRAVKLPITKKIADQLCLVFDSGDEFTVPLKFVSDKDEKPYLKFQYGVGEAQPFVDKYASYSGRKFEVVDELPSDWPDDVKKLMSITGCLAFDPDKGEPWALDCETQESGDTLLFLHNESHGFARSNGGPMPAPAAEFQTRVPGSEETVLFRDDFENGSVSSGWNEFLINITPGSPPDAPNLPHDQLVDFYMKSTDAIDIAEDKSRSGSRSLKMTVARGYVNNLDDKAIKKDRSELARLGFPGEAIQGADHWYGVSILIPKDDTYVFSGTAGEFFIITQWLHSYMSDEDRAAGKGSPPIELEYHPEKNGETLLRLKYGPGKAGKQVFEQPVRKGEWMDLVFHIKWSQNDDGFIEMWKDGEPFTPVKRGGDHKVYGANMANAEPYYFKIGIYRGKDLRTVNSVYFDDVWIREDSPFVP